MNEILIERLRRKLDTLPDDKAYQVLDYIEFLERVAAAGKAAVEEARRPGEGPPPVEERKPPA